MLEHVEFDGRPERALAAVLAAPERPGHAWQRRPDRPIDGQQLVAIRRQARVAAKGLLLGGQFLENFLQERGIDRGLGLRKAAQAHRCRANVFLHAAQRAGGAESAHRVNHRIEERKEQQAQVIALAQGAARISEGALRLRGAGGLQTLLKLVDEPPA